MARINIETKLWADPRFQDLMIKVGRHAAKGMFLELVTLAQEYWFPDRKPIPMDVFERSGLRATVDIGLAELNDGGVQCAGSEKAFSWLFERQESGRKGGEASAKKRKGSGAQAKLSRAKASSSRAQANPSKSNPLTLSLSPSLTLSSSSISSSSSDSKNLAPISSGDRTPAPREPSVISLVWKQYSQAYLKRHGDEATWNSRNAGMLKHFIARVPLEESPDIAEFYVSHNDSYYVRAKHPIAMLLRDAEKLRTEFRTQRQVTGVEARQAERKQATMNVFGPLIAEAEAKEAANG